MSVIAVNKENFDAVTANGTVLLDFYADWCGPCRLVSPLVDEIANERSDILVCKINVDDDPSLAEQFEVFSIPTLVIMKDGNVVEQSAGARPKASILAMIDAHIS